MTVLPFKGTLGMTLRISSLRVLRGCKVEPGLAAVETGSRYQFERLGYFSVDPDSADGRLVFNRTVMLRDTWARIEQAQRAGPGGQGLGARDLR